MDIAPFFSVVVDLENLVTAESNIYRWATFIDAGFAKNARDLPQSLSIGEAFLICGEFYHDSLTIEKHDEAIAVSLPMNRNPSVLVYGLFLSYTLFLAGGIVSGLKEIVRADFGDDLHRIASSQKPYGILGPTRLSSCRSRTLDPFYAMFQTAPAGVFEGGRIAVLACIGHLPRMTK